MVAGDQCRFSDLPACEKVAKDLNVIIQDQSAFIVDLSADYRDLRIQKDSLNSELTKTAVQMQKAKDKKVPFYRNPWYYLLAGFIGGIFISK